MQAHRQVLTPEQKLRRAETAKAWRLKNAEKLKEYQHNRQIRDGVRISERKKKFALEHPELIKERSKAYYEENREAITQASKEYRLKNLDTVRATANAYRKTPKGRLQMYRASAGARGYDFALSTDEFNSLLFADCHYCGQNKANGVDRKDSSKGYFSYNVVACCKTCNYMKGTLNYVEFLEQIQKIIKRLSN